MQCTSLIQNDMREQGPGFNIFRIILQHCTCAIKSLIIVFWICIAVTHLITKIIMSMGSSECQSCELVKQNLFRIYYWAQRLCASLSVCATLLRRSKILASSLGIPMTKCSSYLHLNRWETVSWLFLTVSKARSKHSGRNRCAALRHEEELKVTCLKQPAKVLLPNLEERKVA